MINHFFFDSFALIEVVKGSSPYRRYLQSGVITTQLNLFELYYALIRSHDEPSAKSSLRMFSPFTINYDEDDIAIAASLKLSHRSKNLSMADCIGYTLARRCGIPFLTGDKQFQDMPGVEFVPVPLS